MYYVYVLKNRVEGQIYIGYTEDLRRRLQQHKNKNPELIYYEAYKSRSDARKREKNLKYHGQSKRKLKERLAESIT